MPTNKGVLLLLLGLLCALMWVGLNGCNDKPTDPKPVEPKNYAAYFYEGSRFDSNWFFEYFPETNDLDSFFLPCGGGLVVSADGSTLYTMDRNRMQTAMVDLGTRKITGYLPYTAPIAASPDNRLLAVSQYQKGFSIIRTRDLGDIYFDSTISIGVFSFDSRSFYGYTTDHRAFRLSLDDMTSWRKGFAEGSVYKVMPSPDEEQLYLYMAAGPNAQTMFAVYDFASDSIIFRDYFSPGGGDIEVGREGKFVFYSNPDSRVWMGGDPWIRVYDVESNRSADSISTAGIFPEPYIGGMPATFMALTPDNRWLIALPLDWPAIFAVDLRSMSIARYQMLLELGTTMALACQSGR